jgi:hypothetical protein
MDRPGYLGAIQDSAGAKVTAGISRTPTSWRPPSATGRRVLESDVPESDRAVAAVATRRDLGSPDATVPIVEDDTYRELFSRRRRRRSHQLDEQIAIHLNSY